LKPITVAPSDADSSNSNPNGSIPVRLSLFLIRGYKVLISPYFTGSCRFLPTCADYAAEAIARHGIVRGYWLAARRLVRCHPFCAAGYDPVPTQSKSDDGWLGAGVKADGHALRLGD
jgi:putative membrane protein insertion efficiency factor